MAAIDAHDLHERTAEILKDLRENGEPIDITDQGRVVARLSPVEPLERPRPTREEIEAWWARMDEAAEEIGKKWPEGVSAAQAISEDRREL
jgi:antitoxin (DNA-binding transcriptional repressor) of toxin-antitoxin stability system